MDKLKVTIIAIISTIMSGLGILAIPVFLLVGCNVMDYITGLIATRYRNEVISSYKGIRGIYKKVCMWLLVIIGSFFDVLINYTVNNVGFDVSVPFIVATTVAVWLIVNEIISILENMIDIGVKIPPFLMPLAKMIKKKVEDTTEHSIAEKGESDDE